MACPVRINECMDTHAWDLLDANDKERLLKGLAAGKALGPPRLIDLEWSRRRLLPHAPGERRASLAADEMDLYTLEMLFEEMEDAGVKGLVLGGCGDPLEHKSIDSLLKRLSRVPFALCSLSTGGSALRGRVAELLSGVLHGRLEVRLDAGAAQAVSDGTPHPVADNLRALRPVRAPGGRCRLAVRFVFTPQTCGRLGAMAEGAFTLGADSIVLAASRGEGDPLAFLERRKEFLEAARDAFEADTEGRIESIETGHPLLEKEMPALRSAFPGRYPGAQLAGEVGTLFRTACVMPWLGLAVAPNGAAHPCRRALERGVPPVGSIHAHPLERIWKERSLRNLRRSSRGARWDGKTCAACRPGEGPPLPFALDRAFCQELDSLLRGGLERAVRFPERLRDREWSTVVLPLRHLWPWGGDASPEVRVDGVPVGAAAGRDGCVAIRFLPDGLPQGFHLLEVVDCSGRLLKARVVEKVGS